MAEAMSGPVTHCPWCSAPLPDAAAERCPSCDAVLTPAATEGEIRGVTTLDPEAILRARSEVSRPRNRILSFITGEVPAEEGGPANPESLAPPPDDVRREMLRLQLEAERADLTAETVALKSDELVERGIPLSELAAEPPVAASTADVAAADAPASAPETAPVAPGGPSLDAPPPPPAPPGPSEKPPAGA
jgi:hypothetical protein